MCHIAHQLGVSVELLKHFCRVSRMYTYVVRLCAIREFCWEFIGLDNLSKVWRSVAGSVYIWCCVRYQV